MPEAISATPVISEQDKVAPEIEATVRLVDKKQRACSIAMDFEGGTAVITIGEGEESNGKFEAVRHPQREIDLNDVAGAIANKSKAAVVKALADFCLSKGTEAIMEEP